MFDLNKYTGDSPITIDILNPRDHKPSGIRVTVVGKESSAYRSFIEQKTAKQLRKAKQGRGTPTPQEIEDDVLDLLVACTVGWEGVERGDKAIPFTPGAAKDIYRQFKWLRKQVDEAIGDDSLFFDSSLENSSSSLSENSASHD